MPPRPLQLNLKRQLGQPLWRFDTMSISLAPAFSHPLPGTPELSLVILATPLSIMVTIGRDLVIMVLVKGIKSAAGTHHLPAAEDSCLQLASKLLTVELCHHRIILNRACRRCELYCIVYTHARFSLNISPHHVAILVVVVAPDANATLMISLAEECRLLTAIHAMAKKPCPFRNANLPT